MAWDVRTPVKQSHLPTLMAQQCTVPVSPCADRYGDRQRRPDPGGLVECREAGDRVIVVDAASWRTST
ncbi:MAG: hypothetical protein R2719_13725 [Micropruina sp.]